MSSITILTTLFLSTSTHFNLPSGLLESICYVESKYDVNAVHKDDGASNSVGVCQIKLKTAEWLGFKGTEKELMKPVNNIYYAGKYLAYQLKRYKAVNRSVIAYNIGHAKKELISTEYSDKVFKQWSINSKKRRIACETFQNRN